MPNLTKRELVVRISEETGITQSGVFEIVQKTLNYITEALASGSDVELRNFGVFEVRLTKPRIGRNPNEPTKDVQIPARAMVKFKSGKAMKEQVLKRTGAMKKEDAPGKKAGGAKVAPAKKEVAAPAKKAVVKPAAKEVAKPVAKEVAKPAAKPVAKVAAKPVAAPAKKSGKK